MNARLIFPSLLALLASMVGVAYAAPVDDLHTAAAQCDVAAVQAALDAGADVDGADSSGHSPLTSAVLCTDAVRLLLDAGADPNSGTYPAAIQAASNYSVDALKMLLDAGADANKEGTVDPGKYLLVLAEAEKKKGKDANKAMIKAWEGAAKSQPKSQVSALQMTLQGTNCVPCLAMLLDAGADATKPTPAGSPMHVLATFSQTRAMRKDGFAKGVETMGSFGVTVPSWYGALPNERNGTAGEMVELLAKAGADVNEARDDGMTAFGVAMRLHKLDLTKGMVRSGGDVASKMQVSFGGKMVDTWPVAMVAEFADVELMQLVLEKKPDVNVSVGTEALAVAQSPDYEGAAISGGTGYTPLIISLMVGKTDVAGLLLDAGAEVQTGSSGTYLFTTFFEPLKCLVTTRKKTPIYWAVERDDLALVERIAEQMEWKFNPDFKVKSSGASTFPGFSCPKFKSKLSPSIYAMTVGNPEASKILADKGL